MLDYGIGLADARAYNIQFVNFEPIFIDYLLFRRHHRGDL